MKRIVLYFLMLVSLSVQGQTSMLTLHDAINIALKNSLDLQLAKNDIETNTILNNYGVAGGLPLVTGSVTNTEQLTSVNQQLNTGSDIKRNAAAGNNLSAGVTGSILIYNGSRVIATKNRLAELEKQSKYQLDSKIQTVMADVMNGYYDIIRQESYVRTIDRSIEVAQKKLDIVKVQQSVGMANNADLFQAQIDLDALVQTKKTQQVVISQAKSELLRLLNLNADSTVNVADTIIIDRNLSLGAVLENISKNPDILSDDEQIKINRFIVRETAALRYPSLRANAGYNYTRNKAAAGQLLLNQNYGPFVGFSLTIPIYNGSVYKRQQRVAEINVRDAEIQKQILARDDSAQVVKMYQSYIGSLQQISAEEQTYQTASKLLDLSLLRFQLRQTTIIEVKNAEQSFEDSGNRLTNFRFAAKTAEIELKKLASQLGLNASGN